MWTNKPTMKKLIPLLLIIYSCSTGHQYKSELDRFREAFVKKGITYAASYNVDSLNVKTLKGEVFYDKDGYVDKMIFYNDDGSVNHIEKSVYQKDHVLSEIKKGKKQDSLITVYKKTVDRINDTEIEFDYTDDGHIYKSIYKNDSLGRNLYKEFYKDTILIGTYKFDWCDSSRLCEIRGFDPDGNQSSRLVQTYEDGLISSKIKYENDKITESESYSYNKQRLTKSIITEVPEYYWVETEIKYKNGLIIEEIMTYKSLADNYINTTKTIWEYKKH
jgi:hypothetical protein